MLRMKALVVLSMTVFAGATACGKKKDKKNPAVSEQPKGEESPESKAALGETAEKARETLGQIDSQAHTAAGSTPSATRQDSSSPEFDDRPSYELVVRQDPQAVRVRVRLLKTHFAGLLSEITPTTVARVPVLRVDAITAIRTALTEIDEILSSLDELVEWEANMTGADHPLIAGADKQLNDARLASLKAINAVMKYATSDDDGETATYL